VRNRACPLLPCPALFDARTQAFPVLPKAQIDRIRASGHVRDVERGEILFEPNDAGYSFFCAALGRMEIVQPNFDGERQIATSRSRRIHRGNCHDPGQRIWCAGA